MTTRPDRCLTVLLPADDPEAAAENADLLEALLAGRPRIAFWQGDATGRPKIVVLFGPVPGSASVPAPVGDAWTRMTNRAPMGVPLALGLLGAGLALAAVVLGLYLGLFGQG